jgi:hypothetical protein
MMMMMILSFITLSNSWLVFTRQIPLSLVGPNIFLQTFLSNTIKAPKLTDRNTVSSCHPLRKNEYTLLLNTFNNTTIHQRKKESREKKSNFPLTQCSGTQITSQHTTSI